MIAVMLLKVVHSPEGLTGQEISNIPDRPGSALSGIVLERVTTLGGPDGSKMLGDLIVIAGDSTRRFVADRVTHPGQILVFSPSGAHVRTIGRQGDGPGEFRSVERMLIDRGDSLHVFDWSLGRISVFDPEYALVRTVSLDPPFDPFSFAIHPDGRYVVSAVIGTREAIGYPLHWVGADGRLGASFGIDEPVFLPGDEENRLVRRIHVSESGSLYVARTNEITVEVRSTDGSLVGELRRRPEWFVPWARPSNRDPWLHGPDPYVTDVFVDGQDRLWILTQVASEGLPVPPEARPDYYPDQIDILNDAIVEVIDLQSLRVVARQRFPYLRGFLQSGEVYRWREGADGMPVWDVFRMRLEGNAAR